MESSGRVTVDDGINGVNGRANKETDREDRDGVGRNLPLKVMFAGCQGHSTLRLSVRPEALF